MKTSPLMNETSKLETVTNVMSHRCVLHARALPTALLHASGQRQNRLVLRARPKPDFGPMALPPPSDSLLIP